MNKELVCTTIINISNLGKFYDLIKGGEVSIFGILIGVFLIYEDPMLSYGLVLHQDIFWMTNGCRYSSI